MSSSNITTKQIDAILDRQGHEACPGVEIEFKRLLGSCPDGPELYATIYRPTQRPKTPGLAHLAFHGGAWSGGDPNGCGPHAKVMAISHGITTIAPSYRLATEEKSTFPGLLDDAKLAWNWVQTNASELNIDPAKVIISGESAGVLQASHISTNSPYIQFKKDEPKPYAFIALWGAVDFVARWFDLGCTPGAEQSMLGTHYAINPTLYHKASSITYTSAKIPPALFIYGHEDPIVHARQGKLGKAAWDEAGVYAELLLLHNIGHGIEGDNRQQRKEALLAIPTFLNQLS